MNISQWEQLREWSLEPGIVRHEARVNFNLLPGIEQHEQLREARLGGNASSVALEIVAQEREAAGPNRRRR